MRFAKQVQAVSFQGVDFISEGNWVGREDQPKRAMQGDGIMGLKCFFVVFVFNEFWGKKEWSGMEKKVQSVEEVNEETQ